MVGGIIVAVTGAMPVGIGLFCVPVAIEAVLQGRNKQRSANTEWTGQIKKSYLVGCLDSCVTIICASFGAGLVLFGILSSITLSSVWPAVILVPIGLCFLYVTYWIERRRKSRKVQHSRKPGDTARRPRTYRERGRIPDNVKKEVWQRDGGRCVKCGSEDELEFDHIIPVSKGGSDRAKNLQLLCKSCNRSKSDKIGG